MKIIIVLLFLPLLTSSYNLAADNTIIYEVPSAGNGQDEADRVYFGYSVLLYWSKSENTTWIIVGAPKANYTTRPNHGNEIPVEPGAVYRCFLNRTCKHINIKVTEDEMGFIDQIGRHVLIEKGQGWLGAAMSVHESSGALTVCAPRTNVKIYNFPTVHYNNSMHGVCYEGNINANNLDFKDKNFTNFDFSSKFWVNPMNGFAVHHFSSKTIYMVWKKDIIYPVIGAPKHELYGTVHELGQNKKPAELPKGDKFARFGYALTSGYYFVKGQLMIVGGAPGWQYVGQVGILYSRTDPVSIIATVEGKEVGEYFGASLATGDINRDYLDDLIVGAPHWKNDNGRVHIFLGNRDGFYDADLVIEGDVDDGLFGYAVTSGDFNDDGYFDIIVSAPWEEAGVIYVYNGDKKFMRNKEQGIRSMVPSQRISAHTIRHDLLRFGFSLANPVDIDRNGYSDIAVGAHASGHVVILLSRPYYESGIHFSNKQKLSRNLRTFKYSWSSTMMLRKLFNLDPYPYTISITIDKDYNRVVNPSKILQCSLDMDNCDIPITIELKKNIVNYIDPIDITMTHWFSHCHEKNLSMIDDGQIGKLCPIERNGAPSKTFRFPVLFAVGCGTDNICNAVIWGKLEFPDIRNSTWIIGSSNLRLVLVIGNYAEMAYRTRVTFRIAEGISLKSILPSCQEDDDIFGDLTVVCNVGHLAKTKEKRISLDLDMSRIHNASADGTDLDFRVTNIETDSQNSGATNFFASLHLKADISGALSGKANGDNYRLNSKSKSANVSLQHNYQVSSFGVTRISRARMLIRVPRKLGNLEFLTIYHKPQISLLGRYHDCSLNDLSVSKSQNMIEKSFMEKKLKNEFNLESTVNHSWDRWSSPENTNVKTDAISHGTLENINESKSRKNILSKFYKTSNATNADILYLNCSTPDVTCGLIVCNIPDLRTFQDVVSLQLHLVIDNGKLIDNSPDREKVVYFTTEAHVAVPNPSKDTIVPGFGNIVPVTTTLHYIPHSHNEISIWIILGSVILGLLGQGLLTVFLWKIDFFKRPYKYKLETINNKECIPLESENIFI